MRKFGVCLALAGVSVWSAGCGSQSGGQSSNSLRGGVAVVDLDRVGAETGKSLDMKEAFAQQQGAWRQLLVNAEVNAKTQLVTKAKDLGLDSESKDEPTDEAKREFLQMRANAVNQLTQAQNVAGTKLGQFQQEQIAKFRAELKPILQQAAAKRGLSTVIPKNDGLLLAVDPGIDITDDVIQEYQKSRLNAVDRPAPATPAAPVAAAQQAPSATPTAATASKPAPARTAAKEAERGVKK